MKEKEIIKKLEDFIKNNKLTFADGRRNSDCIVICGYALYLERENDGFDEDVKYYLLIALKPFSDKSDRLIPQLDSTYDYASNNEYALWWEDVANREQYVLEI